MEDVAFVVCTALDRAGVQAVLTGGSAAAYYAPEAYQSQDLDFVVTFQTGAGGDNAMAALGYRVENNTYVHSDSPFSIEFPPGPLMIGSDSIETWSTHRRENDQILHVLSPTDSCRDRLAALLFWNDFSGLEQSLAVFSACAREIDLDLIEDWCVREGRVTQFEIFRSRLQARGIVP